MSFHKIKSNYYVKHKILIKFLLNLYLCDNLKFLCFFVACLATSIKKKKIEVHILYFITSQKRVKENAIGFSKLLKMSEQ